MSFKKMKLNPEQVQTFLAEHLRQAISDITPLSGGQWSQAFGFERDSKNYVVRFGQHEEDYLKDQFACKFASPDLPIPKVLEIGKAFDGYFAISQRANGTMMIDDLDKPDMRRIIPSLFTTMDAIRQSDVSKTTGYGDIEVHGRSKYDSWYDFLMVVNADTPDMKVHGWKEGLAGSPVGMEPFNTGFAVLQDLAKDLPEVRTLVHNDLLNFNVLVDNDRITGVIDWANAFYGDFLYDVAQFTFWGPLHEPVKHIDWEAEAKSHYQAIGLEIPEYDRRLGCCMLNMGLGAMVYYGYKKDWTYLEPVAKRTLKLAKGGQL